MAPKQNPTTFLSLPHELRQQILLLSHEYTLFDGDTSTMKNWTGFSINRERKEAMAWAKTLRKAAPLIAEDVKYAVDQVLAANQIWMSAFKAHQEAIQVGNSRSEAADIFYSNPYRA